MGSGCRADGDASGESLRAFGTNQDPKVALVSLMERGFPGVEVALAGRPYV